MGMVWIVSSLQPHHFQKVIYRLDTDIWCNKFDCILKCKNVQVHCINTHACTHNSLSYRKVTASHQPYLLNQQLPTCIMQFQCTFVCAFKSDFSSMDTDTITLTIKQLSLVTHKHIHTVSSENNLYSLPFSVVTVLCSKEQQVVWNPSRQSYNVHEFTTEFQVWKLMAPE